MSNQIYKFKSIEKFDSIIDGISTNFFGSMKNSDGSLNFENIKKFTAQLGISDTVSHMSQVHSGNVSIITSDNKKSSPQVDGLITNKKHVPLAVLTADCLPILFYDPKNQVIGIAHAGYKGLLNHIIENVISLFESNFFSKPKDILVCIGPSIETKCYEVGKELTERFENTFPNYKKIYSKKEGNFYLDLKSIAIQSLENAGVQLKHIENSKVCTKCDHKYYSYRRGDTNNRFSSIICIR